MVCVPCLFRLAWSATLSMDVRVDYSTIFHFSFSKLVLNSRISGSGTFVSKIVISGTHIIATKLTQNEHVYIQFGTW